MTNDKPDGKSWTQAQLDDVPVGAKRPANDTVVAIDIAELTKLLETPRWVTGIPA